MSKKRIISAAVLIIFALSCDCRAFDNKTTHKYITERAVEKSGLENYLKDNLGLTDSYNTMLNGIKIIEWLRYGSEQEDEPVCRASNHFHDPLKGWYFSYMSDDTNSLL